MLKDIIIFPQRKKARLADLTAKGYNFNANISKGTVFLLQGHICGLIYKNLKKTAFIF